MSRRWLPLTLEILVPMAILGLWWVLSADSESLFFPPLSEIVGEFRELWLFDRFWSDIVPSVTRLIIGFIIAVVLGVAAGLAVGTSPLLAKATNPAVQFLRSIPPPAILPFALAVFGVGSTRQLFIIVFGSMWPTLLNTIDGVRSIDRQIHEYAEAYRIPRPQRIFGLVLPAATPRIFAGARTTLSLATILMVISEMVAATNGIGFFVVQAQRSFAIDEMWAGMLLLGIIGYTLNRLFTVGERYVLHWHGDYRHVRRRVGVKPDERP